MKYALILVAASSALVLAAVGPASAGVINVDMVQGVGGTPPAGSGPWLRVTLDDGNTPGSVTMTLSALNLSGNEHVSALYLNLDPALDPSALVFGTPTKSGGNGFDNPTISTGVNAFQGPDNSLFDIRFSFSTSGADAGSHRFGVGESMAIEISGLPSLTANSFYFFSNTSGDKGPLPLAANIQGIDIGGSSVSKMVFLASYFTKSQGWVSAPEPSGGLLLLLGCSPLFAMARRRRCA